MHRKTPVPESPFKKETLAQVFSCKFCKISKNTFSYRTPPVAACNKKDQFSIRWRALHLWRKFAEKQDFLLNCKLTIKFIEQKFGVFSTFFIAIIRICDNKCASEDEGWMVTETGKRNSLWLRTIATKFENYIMDR